MISAYAYPTFFRIIHMETSEKNISVSAGSSATARESLTEGGNAGGGGNVVHHRVNFAESYNIGFAIRRLFWSLLHKLYLRKVIGFRKSGHIC